MRSSNPALAFNPFSGFGRVSESNAMTVNGTITKSFILLLLVLLPAAWTWQMFSTAGNNPAVVQPWMMGGVIAGLVFAMITIFKKDWAPFTAPLYAVSEGLFLGAISGIFNAAYPGVVLQAISLSMATLLVMLVAYQSGWIKVTDNLRLGIVAATGGIALVYIVSLVLGWFGINVPFITGSSWFSILFSLFVVGIAALNLVLDFDFIEQGAHAGVPKYMEWYGAFSLMVTLIWLYIEILRLLAKISDRK